MAPRLAGLRATLASFCAIGVITSVCFRCHFGPVTVAMLLLLAVLVTATATKLRIAILSALLATVCLDYFFLPPVGSLTISDVQSWVSLAVFCIISVIASHLSSTLRAQRDNLLAQQNESEKIHALSRLLLGRTAEDDLRRLIVNGSTTVFELDEFALFETASGAFYRSSSERVLPEEAMRTATGKQKAVTPEASWTVVPITLGNLRLGSMAFAARADFPEATVNAWAGTVGLGLAQVQAQETAYRTSAERRSEELKSVLLDALAHDLKTPLTSIEAAADMLAHPQGLSPAQANDMTQVIQEETRGLRRLVDQAIHLARIDAHRLKLSLRPEAVTRLIDSAIDAVGERAEGRIHVQVEPGLPFVLADSELIVQALKQLLDNALKYSPAGSPIWVFGREGDGHLLISVRDNGPGLTELEQSRVFDKFYRGRYDRSAIQGTGMGLSIAREIMEAHGGSAGVHSHIGQGTEFFLSFKTVQPATVLPEQQIA